MLKICQIQIKPSKMAELLLKLPNQVTLVKALAVLLQLPKGR